MNFSVISISIIIIGYNTKESLGKLLASINAQKIKSSIFVETIYIDDGSSDGSMDCFNQFDLKYPKKGYHLKENAGRSAATNCGVGLAENEWFFFVRSNETLFSNTINKYAEHVSKHSGVAFMGSLLYSSSDKVFEKYLNNKYRGINSYKNNDLIHYKYLIFGNCLIHSKVFNNIKLNESFVSYGGEELDFAYKLNNLFPLSVRACPAARVFRHHHPGFGEHIKRLFEFGAYNFKQLDVYNQKIVLGVLYYVRNFNILSWCFVLLLNFSLFLYKMNFYFLNFYIIRLGLLSSLLLGVLKTK